MKKQKQLKILPVSFIGLFLTCVLFLPNLGWGATLGSGVPSDNDLRIQRTNEIAGNVFDIKAPDPSQQITPVERVTRSKFGAVAKFPLGLDELEFLAYPSTTFEERKALEEGLVFFTTPHTAAEGAGPVANQPFCLGCHTSSSEAIDDGRIVSVGCQPGSFCVSLVSRGARSSPTNFDYVSFDPATGGGRAPDFLDAVTNAGRTAAFTVFSDFKPGDPNGLGIQDPLDGVFKNPVSGVAQQFGGFVQHVRPTTPECLPDKIPSIAEDQNLQGIPNSFNIYPSGFRRAVAERAGPPYMGRGLIEAVPTVDITKFDDPNDTISGRSTLNNAAIFGCTGDCIKGHHNQIPNPAEGASVFAAAGGVGRFGLRANGVDIFQFVAGGLQGELGFTSLLNATELNSIPGTGCGPGTPTASAQVEVTLSVPFSERNYIRNISLPEFGDSLLTVLKAVDPSKPLSLTTREGRVQRGAMLFGIDLNAFANRMISGKMPLRGDNLNDNALNLTDSGLACAGCHIPVQRTGQSPSSIGSHNLSFKWAPIFSDLLLHEMPSIDVERHASTPRVPTLIARPHLNVLSSAASSDPSNFGIIYNSFDISRNLADDVFSNQKGTATGRDFRTAPLMGLGRMGPPYLHDARVFLSRLTFNSAPASTVTSNSEVTNAPLVVRTVDDAIRAAIELHDLPAPKDAKTPNIAGAGCPVPTASGLQGYYGSDPESVICPPYTSEISKSNRSEAREVIRRFRNLSPDDQQALIEFLKEL